MGYVDPLDRLDDTCETFTEFVIGALGVPITESMVETAISSGELRPVRVGRGYRFSRRMALTWVAERFGVPVDWDTAREEAAREVARSARRELYTAETQLARLGG